ncbi:hypothetical protein A9J41_09245 [Laribacter hongkongensis]|nr:hypothetical protein [Laribacter hongkongensis]
MVSSCVSQAGTGLLGEIYVDANVMLQSQILMQKISLADDAMQKTNKNICLCTLFCCPTKF